MKDSGIPQEGCWRRSAMASANLIFKVEKETCQVQFGTGKLFNMTIWGETLCLKAQFCRKS